MKDLTKIFSLAMLIAMPLISNTSCSSELDEIETENSQQIKRACKMVLLGTIEGYSDSKQKVRRQADTNSTWEDGAKIYLLFTNGSVKVPGEAVYSSSTKNWTVSYYGTLALNANTKCEAHYFEGAKATANAELLELDEHTVIYEDGSGTYMFNGEDLTVIANLRPKTGRIRFTGDYGSSIMVSGISHYKTYDVTNNRYSVSNQYVTLNVSEGTTTDYIYGFYTVVESPRINIINDGNAYSIDARKMNMNSGMSGYLSIPTQTNHNGWESGLILKYENVEFKLISVTGLASNFCIGNTEVTQDLYKAVTGTNPSANNLRGDLPVENVSYKDCDAFCKTLKSYYGFNFCVPSKEQWIYAAQGGTKSQKYIYSGSDNCNDVAWYKDNSNSTTHPVKAKAPNELGLYDMSGNVEEWTSSLEYSYYRSSYYRYGGSYNSEISQVLPESCNYIRQDAAYSLPDLGFRISFEY